MKKESPEAEILGIGNGCMIQSGAVPVLAAPQPMTFGLSDSAALLLRNVFLYREIARQIRTLGARTFVAVAYPGVNLLLCRFARKMGMKVYYFLPPQIWAWGRFRIHLVRRWVDEVISLFPFEAELYRSLNVKTLLIENPLAREMRKYSRTDTRSRIGFMPGSRRSQIRRNLPVILELARLIRRQDKHVDLCMLAYDRRDIPWYSDEFADLRIICEDRYQKMKNCDLLVVCSGTASLEAAFLSVPQVFFNRPSFFDYYVFRRFLRTDEYNLYNILHGKAVVPSYVEYRKRKLIASVIAVIDHAELYAAG